MDTKEYPTCRIKSVIPTELGDSYKLSNYKNVPAAVRDLLMQANDLAREGERLVKSLFRSSPDL